METNESQLRLECLREAIESVKYSNEDVDTNEVLKTARRFAKFVLSK